MLGLSPRMVLNPGWTTFTMFLANERGSYSCFSCRVAGAFGNYDTFKLGTPGPTFVMKENSVTLMMTLGSCEASGYLSDGWPGSHSWSFQFILLNKWVSIIWTSPVRSYYSPPPRSSVPLHSHNDFKLFISLNAERWKCKCAKKKKSTGTGRGKTAAVTSPTGLRSLTLDEGPGPPQTECIFHGLIMSEICLLKINPWSINNT